MTSKTQKDLQSVIKNCLCVNPEPDEKQVHLLQQKGVNIITSRTLDQPHLAEKLQGMKHQIYFTPNAVARILYSIEASKTTKQGIVDLWYERDNENYLQSKIEP